MKAMILAAGRGERLKPLTDRTPKPLITVAGRSLIEYHLQNLADAGFKEIIINTAWLAEKIHKQLGSGEKYGVTITYSDEGTALETAGGIINALPLLGEDAFLVINGDIWSDLDLSLLPSLSENTQAHLILVDNPEHNQGGDFCIDDGFIQNKGSKMYTYSGIGIFKPDFFAEQKPGSSALAPILRRQCEKNLVSGQYYEGLWTDVGTIDRLQELEAKLQVK